MPAHILNVTGHDPSLSNWGLAYGTYNLKTKKLTIEDGLVIQTQSATKRLSKSHDDLERARRLANAAFEASRLAHVTFVEVPTGSQSARGAMSVGIAIGILASLRSNDLPFIHVTPEQLKLATTGQRHASKTAIVSRAVHLYPHVDWPHHTRKGKTILSAKAEHIADAIGAIEAGLQTSDFEQLIALRR